MNRATVYSMPRHNPNERFSVSLPADLALALRGAADRRFHGNISAAIADAISDWLADEAIRARGLAAMDEYETEHGKFTEEELAAAEARVAAEMGWPTDGPRVAS
jgi:Arc/MetJ-type ribon-helix-helix transcriptional regulator